MPMLRGVALVCGSIFTLDAFVYGCLHEWGRTAGCTAIATGCFVVALWYEAPPE